MKKRTYRVYMEESLQIRTKKRKKLQRLRLPMEVPLKVNEPWSMDFVSEQLSNGRRFRALNIVDDYSREMVGQLASVSITGNQVARFLNELREFRSLPKSIVCDNGTKYTSKAMFFGSKKSGVKLSFIQPGKATQNAFVESLNGKFRKECLNLLRFRSLGGRLVNGESITITCDQTALWVMYPQWCLLRGQLKMNFSSCQCY